VKQNHGKWLAENRHMKYLWIPYTDAVVVVKNNPVPEVSPHPLNPLPLCPCSTLMPQPSNHSPLTIYIMPQPDTGVSAAWGVVLCFKFTRRRRLTWTSRSHRIDISTIVNIERKTVMQKWGLPQTSRDSGVDAGLTTCNLDAVCYKSLHGNSIILSCTTIRRWGALGCYLCVEVHPPLCCMVQCAGNQQAQWEGGHALRGGEDGAAEEVACGKGGGK